MANIRARRWLRVATPFWALSAPLAAQALPSSEAVDSGVADIIVTAQRRSESANDIPLSITVLSAKDLAARGFSNAENLSQMVAGFSYVNTGVNAPVYSIRGVGFYETSLAATPAVSVYVDEIPLPYPAMTTGAALDLVRVEVLKGPQGTLYGQNSTGGLVNYISQKPTEEFAAGGSASFARFSTFEASGYISGALGPNLTARFAAQGTRGSGWQRSYTRDDKNGEVDRTAARLLVNWAPTPDIDVLLNLNGWIDKSDTIAPQLIAITPNNVARLLPIIRDAPISPANARAANWNPGQDLYRDDSLKQASVRADWRVTPEATLTSITSYTDYKTDAYNDRDGTQFENSEYPTVGNIDSFFQEVRVAADMGDVLKLIVGANYHRDSSDDAQLIRYRTASNVQNVNGFAFTVGNTRASQEAEGYSGFVSGDWALGSQVTVTTGIRYSNEKRNIAACTYSTDPNQIASFVITSANNRRNAGLPPAPFVTVKDCITLNEVFLPDEIKKTLSEDNISWRAALKWEPTRNLLFYGSVAQGYKSGSFPTQGSSSQSQYNPATQEKVLAYEAGVKAGLFDRRVQLNLAGFYYDYKDKQTRGRLIDPVFGSLQKLVNIPEGHSQGFEIDVHWVPTAGLRLSSTAAYTKSKIDRYVGYTQLGALINFAGKPFSFTPKWQVTGDASYEWAVSSTLRANLGSGFVRKSRTSADSFSTPLFNINGYTLIDVRAGLSGEDDRWSFSVWGRNIGNTYYWTNVFKSTDTTVRIPGYPVSYGVTATVRF